MLISHTIGDFILQTESVVKKKLQMELSGYFKHGLGLFIASLPLFFLVTLNSIINLLLGVIVIIFIHIGMDLIKEKIKKIISDKKHTEKYGVLLFIFDQLIHFTIILIITNQMMVEFNFIDTKIIGNIIFTKQIIYHKLRNIFIVMYVSFSGAYFIPLMFDIVYEKVDNYSKLLDEPLKKGINDENFDIFIDEVKTGKWIGILERILILMFLLNNQLASIGFIIAVKSLARFKMMENKIFSEYFLIGTLMSLVYTFVIYSILQTIFI
ncbi:MAG: DUF3307 domain-containing protein [Bacillota bacterium]